MGWFNILLQHSKLGGARQNIIGKLRAEKKDVKETGCIVLEKDGWRPGLDKRYLEQLKAVAEDAGEKIMGYHIAMLEAGKEMPEEEPPKCPDKWRKVLKRAGRETDKAATWVASHLCHNPKCVNAEHLVWEPSWFNRLRDNCGGGDGCVHRPHRCLAPHRDAEELMDWTELA